jgi:hypothetical protein
MDAALVTALQAPAPTVCWLVQIDLPSGTARLTNAGEVAFDGAVYRGSDPLLGAFSSISGLRDGAATTTTRVDVVVLPRSDQAVADLTDPQAQGSRVRIWFGAINPATGALSGEPELKFDGELDKAGFTVGASWSITLECGTQAERQLEPNEDWRLNHPFHSGIWAGETGLINVTNVAKKIYWRMDSPNGAITFR